MFGSGHETKWVEIISEGLLLFQRNSIYFIIFHNISLWIVVIHFVKIWGQKNKIGISEIISTQNVRNKLVMFLIFHTIGLLCSSKFSCLYETEAIQPVGRDKSQGWKNCINYNYILSRNFGYNWTKQDNPR